LGYRENTRNFMVYIANPALLRWSNLGGYEALAVQLVEERQKNAYIISVVKPLEKLTTLLPYFNTVYKSQNWANPSVVLYYDIL
jgi:hypothetical protein